MGAKDESRNTIFTTGAGSGIGRSLAEAFHHLGNLVIISGRRQSTLDLVTRPIRDEGCPARYRRPTGDSELARTMRGKFPKLNILINNAGNQSPESFRVQSEDLAGWTIRVDETEQPRRLQMHEQIVISCRPSAVLSKGGTASSQRAGEGPAFVCRGITNAHSKSIDMQPCREFMNKFEQGETETSDVFRIRRLFS
jgi:NAD(P)-dependent dehydrogenase (short-subunit alcohol dehydrogenase family)